MVGTEECPFHYLCYLEDFLTAQSCFPTLHDSVVQKNGDRSILWGIVAKLEHLFHYLGLILHSAEGTNQMSTSEFTDLSATKPAIFQT